MKEGFVDVLWLFFKSTTSSRSRGCHEVANYTWGCKRIESEKKCIKKFN